MSFPQGTRVGPYEVRHFPAWRRRHGRGVSRARSAARPRHRPQGDSPRARRHDSGAEDDALDRLLREATLASALNHPNIVTIYETGTVGTDRYIAMELVEGRTLRQLAGEGLPLERDASASRARSPRRSRWRTPRRSSTATSSRTTSWSGRTATSSCSTSALRALHTPPVTAGSTGPGDRAGPDRRHHRLHGAGTGARRDGRRREADIFAFGVDALRARHRPASVHGARLSSARCTR